MPLSPHEEELFGDIKNNLNADPDFRKAMRRAEEAPSDWYRLRVGLGVAILLIGGGIAIAAKVSGEASLEDNASTSVSADRSSDRLTAAEALLKDTHALRATGTCAIELAATRDWIILNPTDAGKRELPAPAAYDAARTKLTVSQSVSCVPAADNPNGDYTLHQGQAAYELNGTTVVPPFLEQETICRDAGVRAEAQQIFSQVPGGEFEELKGAVGQLLIEDC